MSWYRFKWPTVANAPAYNNTVLITATKSFIARSPDWTLLTHKIFYDFSVGGSIPNAEEDISPYATFHLATML
jgi:hypothetical protein